jgi:hypothetical protein
MKYRFLSLLFSFLFGFQIILVAQDKGYFYTIPATPEKYTAENVAARMVDGLGFRYFWGTEGLRPEDLIFDVNDVARDTRQTLDHICDLTAIIKSSALMQGYIADTLTSKYTFEELRNKTLDNLKIASEAFKKSDANVVNNKIVFNRPDGSKRTLDFWYLINGPISDALWHVGQVVSFRRSSGNPLPKGVNVLMGTKN